MAAVGGGPGFEFVGLAALAMHLRAGVEVECLSFDIEQEWGALLGQVVESTCDAAGSACCDHLPPEALAHHPQPATELVPEPEPEPDRPQRAHCAAFVQSDCLTGKAGPELLEAAPSIDLFTFNYVMVENAKALRTDKFAYLRQVFSAAPIGCVFCFMVRRFQPHFRDVLSHPGTFWPLLDSVSSKRARSGRGVSPMGRGCGGLLGARERRAAICSAAPTPAAVAVHFDDARGKVATLA